MAAAMFPLKYQNLRYNKYIVFFLAVVFIIAFFFEKNLRIKEGTEESGDDSR